MRAYNSGGDSAYSNEGSATTHTSPPVLPTVITGLATNITHNSAILNGTANPNGVATGAFFQWGIDTSYGNITPSQIVGSGISNVNVTANLTDLSPNTTYHFRIVATNSEGGTSFGADQTFKTYKTVTVANTGGYGLHLHNGAGLTDPVIKTLPDGTQMAVIDGPIQADGHTWWKITGSPGTGWSAVGEWLTPAPQVGTTVTVTYSGGYGLRLRSVPGLTPPVIAILPDGTQMTVFAGPIQVDGYTWWAIQGYVEGILRTGWSAVGNWLIPNPRD